MDLILQFILMTNNYDLPTLNRIPLLHQLKM